MSRRRGLADGSFLTNSYISLFLYFLLPQVIPHRAIELEQVRNKENKRNK
jgi:hypothetical protein